MDHELFLKVRTKLGKTQKQLAELLGISLKAVQSYEQGWRPIPTHIERQIFFLLINQRSNTKPAQKNCWTRKQCAQKKQCPAWEFQVGHLCWFINGTQCACTSKKDWKEKMSICRSCDVLTSLL